MPFRSSNAEFASHGVSIDITAEILQLIFGPNFLVNTLRPRRILIVVTNHLLVGWLAL